jgi:hypothetical protein
MESSKRTSSCSRAKIVWTFETLNLAIVIMQCGVSHRCLRRPSPRIAKSSDAFVIGPGRAGIALSWSVLCWMLSKENELSYAD